MLISRMFVQRQFAVGNKTVMINVEIPARLNSQCSHDVTEATLGAPNSSSIHKGKFSFFHASLKLNCARYESRI